MMQRSAITLRIHIRTCCNKQFDDFFVTYPSRPMQRSLSNIILRIHIHAISQVLFDGFNVSSLGSIVN